MKNKTELIYCSCGKQHRVKSRNLFKDKEYFTKCPRCRRRKSKVVSVDENKKQELEKCITELKEKMEIIQGDITEYYVKTEADKRAGVDYSYEYINVTDYKTEYKRLEKYLIKRKKEFDVLFGRYKYQRGTTHHLELNCPVCGRKHKTNHAYFKQDPEFYSKCRNCRRRVDYKKSFKQIDNWSGNSTINWQNNSLTKWQIVNQKNTDRKIFLMYIENFRAKTLNNKSLLKFLYRISIEQFKEYYHLIDEMDLLNKNVLTNLFQSIRNEDKRMVAYEYYFIEEMIKYNDEQNSIKEERLRMKRMAIEKRTLEKEVRFEKSLKCHIEFIRAENIKRQKSMEERRIREEEQENIIITEELIQNFKIDINELEPKPQKEEKIQKFVFTLPNYLDKEKNETPLSEVDDLSEIVL